MDTSALTGESVPREVQPESSVLSGCINNTGVLTIEVTKDLKIPLLLKFGFGGKWQAAEKQMQKTLLQSLQDTILPSL